MCKFMCQNVENSIMLCQQHHENFHCQGNLMDLFHSKLYRVNDYILVHNICVSQLLGFERDLYGLSLRLRVKKIIGLGVFPFAESLIIQVTCKLIIDSK